MDIFDIVVLSVYSIFAVIGIFRGFIKELFQISSMVGGFAGAYFFHPIFATYIQFIPVAGGTLSAISFIILFLLFFIIITVLGIIIKKIVHMTPLGLLDRLFGGISGIAKATILLLIFSLSMNALPNYKFKKSFSDAYSYKFANNIPLTLKSVKGGKVAKIIKTVKNSNAANKFTAIKKSISTLEKSSELLKTRNN